MKNVVPPGKEDLRDRVQDEAAHDDPAAIDAVGDQPRRHLCDEDAGDEDALKKEDVPERQPSPLKERALTGT